MYLCIHFYADWCFVEVLVKASSGLQGSALCQSQVLYNCNRSREVCELCFRSVSPLFWLFSAKLLWSQAMINTSSHRKQSLPGSHEKMPWTSESKLNYSFRCGCLNR